MRLRTYANAIQPLEHVFDAFWFLVDFGKGSVPDTSSVDAATVPMGILPTVPVQIRDDLGVPALVFNSETEAPAVYPVRQPDTDTLRLWEVAGTCHTGGTSSQTAMAELFERDGIAFALGGTAGSTAAPENPNVLSFTPANRAAFQHFHTWIRGGAPPPLQPRIEFEPADEPTIRRDRFGNALGGIRLPDFAVPTGEHMGTGKGDVLASLVGYSRPFTAGGARRALPESRGVSQPLARGARPRCRGRLHPAGGRAGDEGGRRRDRSDGVPEIAGRARGRARRHLLAV